MGVRIAFHRIDWGYG